MNLNSPRRRQQIKRSGVLFVSIVSFLLAWYLGSVVFPDKLPAPYTVITLAISQLSTPGPRFYTGLDHLQTSLIRVFIILVVSLSIGTVIGVAMGINSRVEALLSNWLPVSLTLPDVVVVLIFMIILGFNGDAVVLAIILTATPFGVVNIWQGTKDLDPELIEMAQSYGASNLLMLRYLLLPHLYSYMFASIRYMIGMIWKLVLVGEAFGTQTGIGAIIRFWFSQGAIAEILAYLTLFVAVMFIFEYIILKPIGNRAFAWRDG